MIYVHQLDGCAPTPLAHYLKALGILRLVAEQADLDARGWWDGDRFRLATKLNRKDDRRRSFSMTTIRRRFSTRGVHVRRVLRCRVGEETHALNR